MAKKKAKTDTTDVVVGKFVTIFPNSSNTEQGNVIPNYVEETLLSH